MNNNLEDYEWNIEDKEVIKNIFIHVIYTYIMAFIEYGFTHCNLYYNNVLLYDNVLLYNNENNNNFIYKIYTYIIPIPIKKFKIRLLNCKKIKLDYDFNQLYKDLKISFLDNICNHNIFNKIFDTNKLSLLSDKFNYLLHKYNNEFDKNKETSIKYAILLLEIIKIGTSHQYDNIIDIINSL